MPYLMYHLSKFYWIAEKLVVFHVHIKNVLWKQDKNGQLICSREVLISACKLLFCIWTLVYLSRCLQVKSKIAKSYK